MNRDEKAAVIEEVADQIRSAETIFAVDYRGLSVKDAAELRNRLVEAGATFRVVKNRLTIRAADAAGAEALKELLEGPTAFTFITEGGDAAMAAKALAQFRRETQALAFKGGQGGLISTGVNLCKARPPLFRGTLDGWNGATKSVGVKAKISGCPS